MRSVAWCPECGRDPSVDEDGCCITCGNGAIGPGADKAASAYAEGFKAGIEAAATVARIFVDRFAARTTAERLERLIRALRPEGE